MISINSAEKNRKLIFNCAAFFLPVIFIFLLCFSDTISKLVQDGIFLCVRRVVPSLFIFSVLGEIAVRSGMVSALPRFITNPIGRLLNISPAGCSAYIFGSLCGFPLGGKITADLYKSGNIEKAEAERLLAFCNNTGPAFTVFLAGERILGNRALGVFLYVLQILLATAAGIILSKGKHSPQVLTKPKTKFSIDTFAESVTGASLATVTVCGFIIFFYSISGLITELLPGKFISAILSSMLEVTSGINSASGLSFPAFSAALSAFSLMFSGISVISQTAALSADCDLSLKIYIKTKLICALTAFVITYASVSFYPKLLPVASSSVLWLFERGLDCSGFALLSGCLFIFCIFILPKKIARCKKM